MPSKDVAIIGVGQSSFVRGYEGSIKELAFEAFREAMQDAKITQKDVDASIFCSAPEYDKQRSPAGVMAEYLGLIPQPTFYLENVCSSSSQGVKVAYSMIKAGLHDLVVVCGFQKMSEISSAESQERMGRGADIQWESPFGTMMPGYYALYAQAYMAANGLTLDDLMSVRIKSGTYGQINERAVYRKGVSAADFDPTNEKARMWGPVASPLRVGDCCANADGSSCIILASADRAKALCEKPIWIMGLGAASAAVNMPGRPDFTKGLQGPHLASAEAYKMAGITAADVDVAEVHDCFTITEMVIMEDLMFSERGKAPDDVRSGFFHLDGGLPINTDGGLKCFGHPIGASGLRMIFEAWLQLRGDAPDERRISTYGQRDLALVHNLGGYPGEMLSSITVLGSS